MALVVCVSCLVKAAAAGIGIGGAFLAGRRARTQRLDQTREDLQQANAELRRMEAEAARHREESKQREAEALQAAVLTAELHRKVDAGRLKLFKLNLLFCAVGLGLLLMSASQIAEVAGFDVQSDLSRPQSTSTSNGVQGPSLSGLSTSASSSSSSSSPTTQQNFASPTDPGPASKLKLQGHGPPRSWKDVFRSKASIINSVEWVGSAMVYTATITAAAMTKADPRSAVGGFSVLLGLALCMLLANSSVLDDEKAVGPALELLMKRVLPRAQNVLQHLACAFLLYHAKNFLAFFNKFLGKTHQD